MNVDQSPLPWRVIAISVTIFVVLAAAGWMIFGASEPAPSDGALQGETLGDEGDPDAGDAPVAGDTTVDGAGGAEADPGELDPTDPATRAALARARFLAGSMDVRLFLVVPGVERLIPVPHQVAATATLDSQAQSVVEELINWTGSDTTSPLPPEAAVRELWVSPGGIAYVDFNRAFSEFSGGGSLGELHCVYSVVTSLAENFPEIFAVQILVDGKAVESLSGHVDLSRPLLPSNDWALIEQGGPSFEATDGG